MKRFFATVIFLVLSQSISLAKEYNVSSFGAVGDGQTMNTIAIQKAIDLAHKEGGGKVIIPSGKFLSGSIVLKSGVELHLMRRATLLGSTKASDYIKLDRWYALIMANNAKNIGVTGKGVIDGQGKHLALHVDSLFYAGHIDSSQYRLNQKRPGVDVRPQVIEFVRCVNIKVTGITIRNSASYVQSYQRCKNMQIDRIRVESDTYWNNDGMDVIDCVNVRITNCFINSSDDGICLKSIRHPDSLYICDSIYIANCTIRSSASAIKLGTASYGGFKNIKIENIKVYDTFRSAIALEAYSNGVLENIVIKNVKAKNTGNAIFIRLGDARSNQPAGTLRNVTIKNIKAKIAYYPPDSKYEIRGPQLPFFHNIFPSSITGVPDFLVQNVHLENIKIVYPGRGNQAYANMPVDRLDDVPENANHYPEFSMFGELPSWGFYIRHVEGLTLKNVVLKVKKEDYRPAIVLDDVNNSSLEGVKIEGDKKPISIIQNRVSNVTIVHK